MNCEFHLTGNGECANQMIRFIVQDACQDFPIYERFYYDIKSNSNRYQVFENNKLLIDEPTIHRTVYKLLGHMHSLTFKYLDHCVSMHAGYAGYNQKRIIFAGNKGAGKTTLMTRLLFEGLTVDGDELLLIDNETIFPFPRRFHIKSQGINFLSQILPIKDIPRIVNESQDIVYSFSPSEAGFSWQIKSLPADVIVYLESNHNSDSYIEQCPKYLMVQKLMPLTFFSKTNDHLKIKTLCQLVNRTSCYSLHIGSLDMAVFIIKDLLYYLNFNSFSIIKE